MTNKEKILKLYPSATLNPPTEDGIYQIWVDHVPQVYIGEGVTPNHAWDNAWQNFENQIINSFPQLRTAIENVVHYDWKETQNDFQDEKAMNPNLKTADHIFSDFSYLKDWLRKI